MSNRKEYISTFYNKNKVRFFLAILVLILYCFMQIIVANILQILTDVAAERDADKLIKFILYSGIYIFILIIVQTMYKNTRLPFIKKAIEQFKNKSFEEIINKNISTFSTENTSSYISALTNDLKTIEENYLLAIFNIYKNIVLIFGALLMMFYFEWSMTLVVVVLSFLPLLISNALSGNLTQKEKEVSIQNDNYVALIKDLLLGFYVIKSSIAETEILKLYQSKNRQLEDAKYRRRNAASVISIISSVVSFIA
jgi:ABC-type multidrug transport system fused ATPase/permease subunit